MKADLFFDGDGLMIAHGIEHKNAETWEIIFWLDMAYFGEDFYVIDGNKPGEPVNTSSYVILIHSDGSRVAWFMPGSGWTTYSRYPVFNATKASDYDNKIHFGYEAPYLPPKLEND